MNFLLSRTISSWVVNPKETKHKLPTGVDSVHLISTIASAIADTSVSTDPSQLAAMIKALSNKTRETFQEDNEQKDYSTESHFFPSDIEKVVAPACLIWRNTLQEQKLVDMNADWKTFQEPVVHLIFGIYLCKRTDYTRHPYSGVGYY